MDELPEPPNDCPRCAQTPDQRRKDHKTKHLDGCPRRCKRVAVQRMPARAAAIVPAVEPDVTLLERRESGRRITHQVREGLVSVFQAMGGERALLEWAIANPSTFFQMWARAVPRESETANRGAGITVVVASAADIRRGAVVDG